jgi:hypothetical protein
MKDERGSNKGPTMSRGGISRTNALKGRQADTENAQ